MKPLLFFLFFLFLATSASALRVGVHPLELVVGDDVLTLINPEEYAVLLHIKSTPGVHAPLEVFLEAKEKKQIEVASENEGSIEIFGGEQISAGLVVMIKETPEEIGGVVNEGMQGIWFFVFVNLALVVLGGIAWKKNIFSF